MLNHRSLIFMSTAHIQIKRKSTRSGYPRPCPINKNDEYAVEEILDHKDGKYQILWGCNPQREATWKPFENLATCQDLVKAFEKTKSLIGGLARTSSGGMFGISLLAMRKERVLKKQVGVVSIRGLNVVSTHGL